MAIEKKISVLMPAYNAEAYIVESIESILNQSFQDFELIIIDDCSTDKTWEIIRHFERKDPRIRACRNDANMWIAGNRNKLINLAESEYLVWQDADDISMEYRLQKQYDYMESHPNVGICWGGLQFFNANGDTSKRLYKETDSEIRKTIFRYSPVSQPASIVRKSALLQVGWFDEWLDVAEDLNLSFKIGRFYEFANLRDIVVRYRESPNSTTFQKLQAMELATLRIRWGNYRNGYYGMTVIDKIYNLLQLLSVYFIPAKWKIALFNFIRNI